MTTRLYITDRIPNEPVIFPVGVHDGVPSVGATLFTAVNREYAMGGVVFVDDLQSADYVLYPHALKSKCDSAMIACIRRARDTALAQGKTLVVFIGGDLSHNIFLDGVVVCKGSQYRSLMRENEVLIPPFAEDLGAQAGVELRTKSGLPTVSFCGWAGFKSMWARVKYVTRLAAIILLAFARPSVTVYKKGVYWRRRAMRVLAGVQDIKTHFIVRRSFSGNSKTIDLDTDRARREYVDSIAASDYVLAPKGDGNFSVRFYEALSLGRLPILIDTDTPLPLEHEIQYDRFIVRVPYQQVSQIGEYVLRHYAAMDEEAFRQAQRDARQAYEQFLRYDVFFEQLFSSQEFTRALASLKKRDTTARQDLWHA